MWHRAPRAPPIRSLVGRPRQPIGGLIFCHFSELCINRGVKGRFIVEEVKKKLGRRDTDTEAALIGGANCQFGQATDGAGLDLQCWDHCVRERIICWEPVGIHTRPQQAQGQKEGISWMRFGMVDDGEGEGETLVVKKQGG